MKFQMIEHLSINTCMANPNKLYVFGDNQIRAGRGGQAIIRHMDNSYGIATKRLPTMEDNAFFSDTQKELSIVIEDIIGLQLEAKQYTCVVFPRNGIGTGLAKMEEKSPDLFVILQNMLNIIFDEEYIK